MKLEARCLCKHCLKPQEMERNTGDSRFYSKSDTIEIVWECRHCKKDNSIVIRFN